MRNKSAWKPWKSRSLWKPRSLWKLGAALLLAVLSTASGAAAQQPTPARWTPERADAWYAKQPWLVGANFLPSTAGNELEMWQADTFDPATIDRELGWAQAIGMNTMRVFLHNLLWEQDPKGFTKRINTFLAIAAKHHIRPVFVLFDSCWDPNPKLGPQRQPTPGVHNSVWVQAPGTAVLTDSTQYPRLERYVKGVVSAFAKDDRILAWDVWNEPSNRGGGNYDGQEPPNKEELVRALLPQVFTWARSAHPRQPLTSGVWEGDWSSLEKMTPMSRIQIEQSDVISFHNYGPPTEYESRVKDLEQFHRPLLCTEYMARPVGSTFDAILPIAKAHHVGSINWGLVQGKMQTWLPWDSWQHPYDKQPPAVWFHDVFYTDGKPYRQSEVDLIHNLTGRP